MTTKPNIKTFDFAPGLSIRAIVKDGQPLFIAYEVCNALGFSNPSRAVASHVDPEDKYAVSLDLPGSSPLMVNESGLYSLILRSRKPQAKAFQRWVTSAVLPALRKGGLYVVGQEKPITDDLTVTELMAQMAEIQAKVDALKEAKLREWSKHQEEKEARSAAFKFFRGGTSKHTHRKTPALLVPHHSHR